MLANFLAETPFARFEFGFRSRGSFVFIIVLRRAANGILLLQFRSFILIHPHYACEQCGRSLVRRTKLHVSLLCPFALLLASCRR